MPVSLTQFADQVVSLELLSADELRALLSNLPAEQGFKDAEALALYLVGQNKLTTFQAQQILKGKGPNLLLGSYLLLQKLGEGGMGVVFKAQHRRMQRLVALKVMGADCLGDRDAIKRFQREVQAVARLSHPNVVTAHDAGESRGTHFLVMEFVSGSDMDSLVRRGGPLSAEQALGYVLQAARGLEYAHGQGIVHRDIKPANLLLSDHGTIKVLDLGLARVGKAGDEFATRTDLTGAGQIMGTIDFMAPEQALNAKYADHRADIYSLGATLWFFLTGQVMYAGETILEKLLAQRSEPIPSLAKHMAGSAGQETKQLDALLKKMVAKLAVNRFQSMTELIADLEEVRISCAAAAAVGVGPSGSGQSGPSLAAPSLAFASGASAGAKYHLARSIGEMATEVGGVSPLAAQIGGEIARQETIRCAPAPDTMAIEVPRPVVKRPTIKVNWGAVSASAGAVLFVILAGFWIWQQQFADRPLAKVPDNEEVVPEQPEGNPTSPMTPGTSPEPASEPTPGPPVPSEPGPVPSPAKPEVPSETGNRSTPPVPPPMAATAEERADWQAMFEALTPQVEQARLKLEQCDKELQDHRGALATKKADKSARELELAREKQKLTVLQQAFMVTTSELKEFLARELNARLYEVAMHHHASQAGKLQFFDPIRRNTKSLDEAIPRAASAAATEAALSKELEQRTEWYEDKQFTVPGELTPTPLYPEVLKLLKNEIDCLATALKDLRVRDSRVRGHETSIANMTTEIRALQAALTAAEAELPKLQDAVDAAAKRRIPLNMEYQTLVSESNKLRAQLDEFTTKPVP
ncbi:MAG: protein kinase [Pirellulaceae bacterium]|nr:protein kinase [Pirellulaceae bacterium]